MEKTMKDIYLNFAEKAINYVKDNPKDIIKQLFDRQISAIMKIIETKNLLPSTSVNSQIIKTFISLSDEYFELSKWLDKPNYFEAMFEQVDMLHFLLQLAIFGYMKENKIRLDELWNDEAKDKIIDDLSNFYSDFKFNEVEFKRLVVKQQKEKRFDNNLTYPSIIHTVINTFNWKDWKNYPKDFKIDMETIHYAIYINLYRISFNFTPVENPEGNERIDNINNIISKYCDDSFLKCSAILYFIKNMENIDRQERGY